MTIHIPVHSNCGVVYMLCGAQVGEDFMSSRGVPCAECVRAFGALMGTLDVDQEDKECVDCGCTDLDCRCCIESTGERCFWVVLAQPVCSACFSGACLKRSA